MVILSRKDIEKISRVVLARYLALTEHELSCIDPVDFAEKLYGIRFVITDISVTGNLLGLTSFSDISITIPCGDGYGRTFELDGKVAYIDQRLEQQASPGRLNFTLMHEVAHQILGDFFPEEYNFQTQPIICRYADETSRQPICWPEWQTNVLASCLLMPRELIRKHMAALGMGDTIKRLNRVFSPGDYRLFSQLAEMLGVSKTALSIRLNHLGVIARNDFYDPYALVNVFPEDHEYNSLYREDD